METTTAARTLTLGVCELLPLCELVFRVCVCVHFTHTDLGWTRWPSLGSACGPSWESGARKHTSNTHTLSFIGALQMTKHFLDRLRMNIFFFSDRLSALMDVAAEPVCRRAPGVFAGFLCTLCLDCGLLLTSLWLQTHWHVIYGNEPWRKLNRVNQTHPTCNSVRFFGKERDGKRQDTNKKRHRGESVWDWWAFFLSFEVL